MSDCEHILHLVGYWIDATNPGLPPWNCGGCWDLLCCCWRCVWSIHVLEFITSMQQHQYLKHCNAPLTHWWWTSVSPCRSLLNYTAFTTKWVCICCSLNTTEPTKNRLLAFFPHCQKTSLLFFFFWCMLESWDTASICRKAWRKALLNVHVHLWGLS